MKIRIKTKEELIELGEEYENEDWNPLFGKVFENVQFIDKGIFKDGYRAWDEEDDYIFLHDEVEVLE